MRALLFAAAAFGFATLISANAREHRSAAARDEFKREQPCPSTGKPRGACPGYIIDHRIGLCVGGRDTSGNMRWMTVAAAKAKDKWECKPGWQEKLIACERSGCFVPLGQPPASFRAPDDSVE